MGRLESQFQLELKKTLEVMFPGCIVLKNDAQLKPGIPDLVILWRSKWALLEVKKSATAKERPNQRWYVEKANQFSYGAFIHPENTEEILNELQQAFRAPRSARYASRE